jgi:small subunit ribosomal protein S16
MRFGKRGTPSYRIVALDKRKKRDGSYIENLGTYDPLTNPAKIEINQVRFDDWILKGAQVSEGVRKITKNLKKNALK